MTTVAASPARPSAPPHRQAWIDNLRVAVIIGVIAAHVSIIYALDVGWYYEERTASKATEVALAAVMSPGLLFGMGLMFFIAGLFTPPALERKGPRRFIVDRTWRLGAPVVSYLFIVDPAMNFFGARAEGQGEGLRDYFRRTYLDDVELGVAWFVLALLAFSIAYAAWRSGHPARSEDVGRLRRGVLFKAGASIAVGSFAVRLVWPFLATEELWGLNLWEYPQMLALFSLGALAEERRWLADGLPVDVRRSCARAAVLGVGLAAVVGAAITITDDPDPWLGGLDARATLIPVVEAMITIGTSLWAVDWFRRRRNQAGALVRSLGHGSFTAYLVHAPITVLLAMALSDLDVVAEVKLATVFPLTVAASFAAGMLLARARRAGQIL